MHSQVALAVKKLLANVGDTRDEGSIPGQETKMPQATKCGGKKKKLWSE